MKIKNLFHGTASALIFAGLLCRAFAQTPACPAVTAPPMPSNMLLSGEQEAWLGDFVRAQQLGGLDAVPDPKINAYLDQVTQRLIAVTPPVGFPIHTDLIISDETNAFSIYGGDIHLLRPLVSLLHNENELAGILSHEIGHLVAHEAGLDFSAQLRADLNLTHVGDRDDLLADYNRLETFGQRNQDKAKTTDVDQGQDAADRIGLEVLARAGYPVASLSTAFDRLAGLKGNSGGFFSDLFGLTSVDALRLRNMVNGAAGAAAKGCPQVPPIYNDAAFEAWQSQVVAYVMPAARPQLPPGELRHDKLQPLHESFHMLKFSPDGRYLLATDSSGAWILSREPFSLLFHIDEPALEGPMFSPDSASVVFSTSDQRVERWDIATHRRTMLRQVVPAVPGCAQSQTVPKADQLACLRSDGTFQLLDVQSQSVRFERHGLRLVNGMTASTDGRYILIRAFLGDAFAVDLSNDQAIELPQAIRVVVNPNLTFVGPDQILSTNDESGKEWGLLSFPSGDVVKKLQLAPTHFRAETHGTYLIAQPLGTHAAGVYDPVAGKSVFGANTVDLDGYDDVFAAETGNGTLSLVQPAATQMRVLARLELPPVPLNGAQAVALSPDMNWLAVSAGTHGAIWNLSAMDQPSVLPSFMDVGFGPSHAWFDLSPDAKQREAAFNKYKFTGAAPGSLLTLDLVGHQAHTTPPPVLADRAVGKINSRDGAEILMTEIRDPTLVEMHSADNDELLWKRTLASGAAGSYAAQLAYGASASTLTLFLEAAQTPVATFVSGTDLAAISFPLDSAALRKELQGDRERTVLYAAAHRTAKGLWIELVDRRTGKARNDVVIPDAPIFFLDRMAVLDGKVYIPDIANRVLSYGLADSKPGPIYFASQAMTAPDAHLLALKTGRRQWNIYRAGAAVPVQQVTFAWYPLILRFSADGGKLIALTSDQTIYQFDTTKW